MNEKLLAVINAVPEFMWTNIFTVINTLLCGSIVAFFTSTFLKKKEERTRIAGVIVEKRINSEQEVLHFLESELFKEEINIKNSSKNDFMFDEMLKEYGLPAPYDGNMQYARIFTSPQRFDKFFHNFEEQIMNHKLWLDTKVKKHLVYMQAYFSVFNTIPLMMKRIPLPSGKELTKEEFESVHGKLLLLLGHCCDAEINGLISELDEKIVDSVYKLELSRPKRSMMRANMDNADMKQCIRRLERKSILGTHREEIFTLIIDVISQMKNIDISKMNEEEFDEFFKSSAPREYEQTKKEAAILKEGIESIVKGQGVKIASKDDLEDYPEMYGISLREFFEGKEPIKNKDRKKKCKQTEDEGKTGCSESE